MHCIQGSDAHRLVTDTSRKKNPGIGDRATDMLLPEVAFEALRELFTSNDFSRTRPHRHIEEPAYDFIQTALDEGANIIQDFHESMTMRGGKLYAVVADVCAFLNTNGGTLYVGLSRDPRKPPVGVPEPEKTMAQLEKEIASRISPPIQCSLDLNDFKGKKILRVLVVRGDDPPYAVDGNKIYVRDEAETSLAVRDEIVSLVQRRSLANQAGNEVVVVEESHNELPTNNTPSTQTEVNNGNGVPPRTGVEVLPTEEREGTRYYSMRDLRNGNLVKNVTEASARRLWHYAISQFLELAGKEEKSDIQWQGDYGLVRRYKQDKNIRFDFIQRTTGGYRYFFGVTPDGLHGAWKWLVGEEEL
jgi:hypothetical protein